MSEQGPSFEFPRRPNSIFAIPFLKVSVKNFTILKTSAMKNGFNRNLFRNPAMPKTQKQVIKW